ncbi:FIMAH domain-containing protein [Pseudalkalibacillus sp. A8]|uniref:FIMAH domain-containing protein n=1 Tax=Pseudalkalibacillus sp. A8 TaxID=3382641 RepID=UPI0038B4F565
MVSLVEQYKTDGEFKNNGAAQSLLAQLDTVNHFEQSGEMEKTKHHMYNFRQLLENHKEQNLISDKAFGILDANAKYLLGKWN